MCRMSSVSAGAAVAEARKLSKPVPVRSASVGGVTRKRSMSLSRAMKQVSVDAKGLPTDKRSAISATAMPKGASMDFPDLAEPELRSTRKLLCWHTAPEASLACAARTQAYDYGSEPDAELPPKVAPRIQPRVLQKERAVTPSRQTNSQKNSRIAHEAYAVGTRYCEYAFMPGKRPQEGRLREGLQGRAAMDYSDVTDAADVRDADHPAACRCATCDPFSQKAAGQATSVSESHRYHDAHQMPRPDFAGSPNLDSQAVGEVLETMNEDSGSAAKRLIGDPDVADQMHFRVELGSKIKAGIRRSLSVDASAGRHRQRGGFLHEDRDGVLEGSSRGRPSADHISMQKNGVSYILTPRADDIFASRLRITASKRGDGICKHGLSQEAEKFLTHANEPLYRFEIKAVEELENDSKSLPRTRFTRIRNNTCNPITMEGEHVDDRKTFRVANSNHSATMSTTLAHDLAPKAADADRHRRLASEPVFAELCAHAVEDAAVGGVRRRGNCSSHMADTLKWDA